MLIRIEKIKQFMNYMEKVMLLEQSILLCENNERFH